MSWLEDAEKKLAAEKKAGKYDKYAAIMKSAVQDVLLDFCRENEEFAQAVVQGGTFEACMRAVAKDCGTGLSDKEAFRRAARFYFPGADIRTTYHLDLVGDAAGPDAGGAVLNLADFW